MTPPRPPARAPEAITLEFDDETIVYHRQTGDVHRLSSVGSIIWRLLDGRTTVDELVTDLSAAFEADPSIVRGDVAELLKRLGQASLLADEPAPESRREPPLLTNPTSP